MRHDAGVKPSPTRRLAAGVVAQIALGLFALSVCLPSLQDWPRLFAASQAGVQLTFSAFAVAYGAMQLVCGPWSDHVGRRRVLLAGLALVAAASALAASATDITVLVIARALQGAGCAAPMVVGRALVQDSFEGRARTRVMALAGMAMGLMPPLAALVGGQLHARIGWQANFVLVAAMALALMVPAWRLPARPPPRAGAPGLRQLAAAYAAVAAHPRFRWHALLLASSTAAFYAFLAGAPIVLRGQGVTPERLGEYLAGPCVAYIAGSFATARLARSRSQAWLLGAGQAIALGGLALLFAAVSLAPTSPWAVSLPLAVMAMGHGLLVPTSLAGTVGLVPALAGSAAALAGGAQQLGGALGGLSPGWLDGPAGLAGLMLAASLPGVLAAARLLAREGRAGVVDRN